MTKHKLVWALTVLFLFVCAPARASHKAWVLYHGGGDCIFQTPRVHPFFGGDGGDIVLWNRHDVNRAAVCPVAAAGRWGSSGTENFGVARWAEAKRAYVRVYNGHPTEPFTCQAVARLRVSIAPGGSLYYGTARSVTGQGNHTIELTYGTKLQPTHLTHWGGSLETNEGARLRSLDFQCTVPATAGASSFSYIRGYGVMTCQQLEECHDDSPSTTQIVGGEVSIQGNGSSCSSSSSEVSRSADGLMPTTQPATVTCPIVPAAQDSYEGAGFLRVLKLHYTGTGSVGCENNGTCPSCVLRWQRVSTGAWGASSKFVWAAPGSVELGYQEVPNWSTAAIQCSVPTGQRIRGYSGWGSQVVVSGGQ